jgi:hypothetical protein
MFYPVPALPSNKSNLSTQHKSHTGGTVFWPGWIPTRSVLLPVIAFIGDLGILNQKTSVGILEGKKFVVRCG